MLGNAIGEALVEGVEEGQQQDRQGEELLQRTEPAAPDGDGEPAGDEAQAAAEIQHADAGAAAKAEGKGGEQRDQRRRVRGLRQPVPRQARHPQQP